MPAKGVCRLRMESVGSCFLQEPKVCSARSVIFADKGEKTSVLLSEEGADWS